MAPSAKTQLPVRLAIVDDLGAILVIAVFYSKGVALVPLEWAAAGLALVLACRWLGVRSFGVYVLVGAAIWVAMLKSGVHPTVAGVLLGLLTPAKPTKPAPVWSELIAELGDWLNGDDDAAPVQRPAARLPGHDLVTAARRARRLPLARNGTPIAAARALSSGDW